MEEENKIKEWIKEREENPRSDTYWTILWIAICFMSMLSGAFFAACYYSNQVMEEVNNIMETMAENSPCVANAYYQYQLNYNLSNINSSQYFKPIIPDVNG